MRSSASEEIIFNALESFRVEIRSWAFANTGTRFGKFIQPAAATSIQEKFSDAGFGSLVDWHLPNSCSTCSLGSGWRDRRRPFIKAHAKAFGVNPGSINPNLCEDQDFKFESFGNHDPAIRAQAVEHVRESIPIADYLGIPCLPLWT